MVSEEEKNEPFIRWEILQKTAIDSDIDDLFLSSRKE